MTNSRFSARPRSGAPYDRTRASTGAAGANRSAPTTGSRRSGRQQSSGDPFTTGAFSVGAFSAGLGSATGTGNNSSTSRGRARTNAQTSGTARPVSSGPADRLNRHTGAVTAGPSTGNDGRRRRQRGGEATSAGSSAGSGATQALLAAYVPVSVSPDQAVPSFAELGVPAPLIPALASHGAATPFPIQAATLPATLAGRDVLGRGKTGSGKTIAFAVPLVARLTGGHRAPGRPRGLILLPTRELALQVQRTVAPLAAAVGLRTVVIFGGVGYGNQTSALRSGVDIVIACPGRLEDLVNQKACDLSSVEVTVLDEADHMADLGFLPVVRRLLRNTPARGQRLLFSATLDNGVAVLVKEFLTDPILHAVDDETSPVESMEHHVFAVSHENRPQVIRELAAGGGRRMLFTRTKHSAKKWAAALSKQGIPAVDLHGNLSQNARERNLAAFSSGSAKVLVATDIAARGIHVDDVELVVHLDPPTEHKAYLHRSGRTARAGAGGTVVTVMLPDQAADLRRLMKQAGITASTTQGSPGHPAIAKIAG